MNKFLNKPILGNPQFRCNFTLVELGAGVLDPLKVDGTTLSTYSGDTADMIRVPNGAFNLLIDGLETAGTAIIAGIDNLETGTTPVTTTLNAGAEATPSLTFDGDTNTGVYRVGADAIGISTGGTKRVEINSTGVTSAVPVTITGAASTTTTVTAGTSLYSATSSAATPGHSFTGRTDQGMYSVSATQVGISNGAAGLNLVVDATGISTGTVKAQVEPGTVGAATVTAQTYTNGKDNTTILTLTDFIVGALAGAAANLGIGNLLYTFPAGAHLETIYYSNIALSCAGTAVATDTGLGSVIAAGAIALLSGTATFEDRITGQAITTGVGYGPAVEVMTGATAGVLSGISLNITSSVKAVYLNSAGLWNVDNVGNLTATGTISIKWTKLT